MYDRTLANTSAAIEYDDNYDDAAPAANGRERMFTLRVNAALGLVGKFKVKRAKLFFYLFGIMGR